MKILLFVFATCGFFASVSALYNQCAGVKSLESFEENINVSGCKQTYCRLRKKMKTELEMKFTPEKDTKQITNSVTASIAGIPFPFLGVDGTSACNQIYESDGKTKASCPLKGGTTYVYKNVIDVLEIYPRLKVIVHWALTGPEGDVVCFEVPARITN